MSKIPAKCQTVKMTKWTISFSALLTFKSSISALFVVVQKIPSGKLGLFRWITTYTTPLRRLNQSLKDKTADYIFTQVFFQITLLCGSLISFHAYRDTGFIYLLFCCFAFSPIENYCRYTVRILSHNSLGVFHERQSPQHQVWI